MIIDTLDNAGIYFRNKAWKAAFDFIKEQTLDSEEKKYMLMGEDLYAIVMSYQTRPKKEAVVETHRKYIDVQVMIAGSELIEYSHMDSLKVKTPYDAARDAEFYEMPRKNTGSNLLLPGVFQVFFPWDAHAPGLNPGKSPLKIKKLVVKLKTDLLA